MSIIILIHTTIMDMIYNINDFNEVIFKGIHYELPKETIDLINNLAQQVGAPTYIKTPIFTKREEEHNQSFLSSANKRKKRAGLTNSTNEDWDSVRNYQTTKIEKKDGIEGKNDIIRSYLNKMTNDNYEEMKKNIFGILETIKNEYNESEDINDVIKQVGENIFNIASDNRFYSKLYADLYTDLIKEYTIMKEIFEESFNQFMDLFYEIQFVDSAQDYDKFCKINNDNEKRKSLSCFFINLMKNGILKRDRITTIIQQLLEKMDRFIYMENKINEVNEISENIILLFKKEYFEKADYEDIEINGINLITYIETIANSKSKNFKSLSTKSIFKFMDIVDM